MKGFLHRLTRASRFARQTGWLVSVGAAAFLIVPAGCKRPQPSLRVGSAVSSGYETLFLARSLGYYDGQPVKFLDFPSSTEVIRAYRNGIIDVAAVTADEALLVAEYLPDQRIVLVTSFSNGGDAILAKPGFRSMKDLRGRRIGVETNALGALMLARALELNGLAPKDVIVVPTTQDAHEYRYTTGAVDALVACDPICSRLLAAGARKVFDSSQIPGEIAGTLLTHGEYVEADRPGLAALVDGWFRALEYLRKDPADAARRAAPREQVPPETFLASLKGIEFPDRATNLRLLGSGTDNLAEPLRRLSDVMVRKKLISHAVDPVPLLDARFVKQATP